MFVIPSTWVKSKHLCNRQVSGNRLPEVGKRLPESIPGFGHKPEHKEPQFQTQRTKVILCNVFD